MTKKEFLKSLSKLKKNNEKFTVYFFSQDNLISSTYELSACDVTITEQGIIVSMHIPFETIVEIKKINE